MPCNLFRRRLEDRAGVKGYETKSKLSGAIIELPEFQSRHIGPFQTPPHDR